MKKKEKIKQEHTETVKEVKKPEDSRKKARNKEKLFYGIAVLVILGISIGTANVNLMDEITGAVKGIWNKSQEVVENTAKVEKVSDGAHVDITSLQVVYVREIYEVLGETVDKEQAIAILQEVKTLAYNGRAIGISAGKKEIEAFVDDLKEKMKEADESQYGRVVRRYGDEDDYWTVLEGEIEDYIIAGKVKEDKRKELENKVDADVEKELQEYIDEMVGYENFTNIS